MIELTEFDRELMYLQSYARQNGDTAALRIAADEIVKLRRGYERLAAAVPHEEGTDAVEAAIKRIAELEAERDTLKARVAEVEAQAAAMRKALAVAIIWMGEWLAQDLCECQGVHICGRDDRENELRQMKAALSSSAGRETAERLKRLEAVVEAACQVVDKFQADGGVSEYFEALVELREAVEALRALEGGEKGA